MIAMMTIELMVIPITNPRMLNLLAACDAAMASGILPAAYSESTYVSTEWMKYNSEEERDTNSQ